MQESYGEGVATHAEHMGLPARAPPIASAAADEEFPSDDATHEYADVFGT